MTNVPIHHHDVETASLAYAWSHGPVERPLVMLHGLGDSAIHTFSPRLADGPLADYPTLFIDLPGFGESLYSPHHPATIERYAADVASLLQSLDIRPSPVFGHSMGGNVAIHLAYAFPQHVDGLIVGEPLLNASQSILAADIARFSEEAFCSKRYSLLVRATSLQAHRGDVAAAGFLEPLQMASPIAMYRAAHSLIDEAAANSAEMLSTMTNPSAVLVGERTDVHTSDLESRQIRVFRIPNAGHNMLVEQAFQTSYAILEAMNWLELGIQRTRRI